MAKSSWLTVNPTSGFGNKTIQNIGTNHTGRLDRQTVVTGRAIGISTPKTYTVTQKAKSEFITIGAASYSVANTGGIVTISGTSNSPKLTVSVGSGGTLGTLVVNGSTVTNGADISGDPGATVQYSWSIQIQVSENLTAVQKSINVTVTGSSSSVTDTVEIIQAASVFEYIFSIAAGTATIPASGGNSAITAQLTTKRNGEEISTRAVTPTLSGLATGFSISGTTVTAANRGTTVGEARSITVTGKFTTSETGEELSDTVVVSQAANSRVIVYGKPTITSFEVADIPASGGSVSSGDVEYSQSRHYYYDSGQTEELSSLTTGGQVTFGDAVSAGSLGMTVKSRTIVGQLTCQVAMNGQTSVEGDASVYQQANSETYGDVSLTVTSPVSVDGGGGQYSITASGSQTVSFTSGASRAGSVSLSYAQASAVDGFSLNGSTVTASENTTTSTKSYTVNVTATGEGSKTTTKQVVFNQVAGQRTYSEITVNLSYPQASAAGGTVNPILTYSQTWGWNGSTTGGGTITSGASVSYSGNVDASTGVVTVASKGTTVSIVTTVTTATVTVSMNGKTASASCPIYQAKNVPEKIEGSFVEPLTSVELEPTRDNVSLENLNDCLITVTYSSGETLVRYNIIAELTYTVRSLYSYSFVEPVDGWTINEKYGTLAASSMGTTLGFKNGTVDILATLSLKPDSGYEHVISPLSTTVPIQVSITQGENIREVAYDMPTITDISVEDIPASGGTVSSANLSYSQPSYYQYSSGSVEELPSITSGGTVNYGEPVSAESRGTTIGGRKKVGTFTATVSMNGKTSYPMYINVYQEANVQTDEGISYGAWQISVSASNYTTSANACPAGGGTCTITASASRTRTQNYSYTSGDTSTEALTNESGNPTLSISGTGASLSGTTVTWASRGTTTGSVRQATITATIDDESATEVVYQQANEATLTTSVYSRSDSVPYEGSSSDLSMNFSFILFNPFKIEWSSGSDYEYNMTSPTLQPVPDYVKSLFTFETGQPSYVGPDWNLIDSIGVALCVEVSENTGDSERPVSGILHFNGANSQDFSFNINQEVGSYLNVSPASLSFEASGGTKTITIDTNESWTIS